MKRILIIDCQLLQTNALHRGMGKYTLAVLNEYRSLKLPYDKVVVLMGDQKVDAKDEASINKALNGYDIIRLHLKKTKPNNPQEYGSIVENNRAVIDKYIETHYADWNVDFLITSMFQEDGCSAFPERSINKFLLIYDLIPLQFPDYYLKDPRGQYQYLSRYKELFKATHYFTISKTVANDVALQLGIPLAKVTPIDGSYISRKGLKPVRPKSIDENDKFILMPTGDDARKNNLRAAIAFEEFNSKSGYAYKLVVTSFFGEKTKSELRLQSDHIKFTGNVSEEELAWLYANSELILFPSEYEGLGMPPLEAVEFNKPVLCSSIDVFKEISQTAFRFCDPYDVNDISRQLQDLLISNKPKINTKEYKRILADYSWEATAERMIQVYEESKSTKRAVQKKKKIAVFSPIPSGYSAIGKVVQEQHYELSQFADVDYYLETGITDKAKNANIRVNYLPYITDCKNPWTLDEKEFSKYDMVVYHIGNSEYHIVSTIKALAFPSTIVLHDVRLREMFEVVKNQGYITPARYNQEAQLQEAIKRDMRTPAEFKSEYISSIVNAADRVIVHSKYAQDAAKQVMVNGDAKKVRRLNLPTPTPYAVYDSTSREERFTVGYAGIIHAAKGLDLIDDLLSREYKKSLLIKLFGFSLLSEKVKNSLSAIENVQTIISPSDTRFIRELTTCNVIVGYRPDYHGETSLSTLEALRLGRPVIVNDVGWFKEIPERLIYRISDEKEVGSAIERAMRVRDDSKMVEARIEFIRKHHGIENYVRNIIDGKSE